jgi:hypothetical protein
MIEFNKVLLKSGFSTHRRREIIDKTKGELSRGRRRWRSRRWTNPEKADDLEHLVSSLNAMYDLFPETRYLHTEGLIKELTEHSARSPSDDPENKNGSGGDVKGGVSCAVVDSTTRVDVCDHLSPKIPHANPFHYSHSNMKALRFGDSKFCASWSPDVSFHHNHEPPRYDPSSLERICRVSMDLYCYTVYLGSRRTGAPSLLPVVCALLLTSGLSDHLLHRPCLHR